MEQSTDPALGNFVVDSSHHAILEDGTGSRGYENGRITCSKCRGHGLRLKFPCKKKPVVMAESQSFSSTSISAAAH